MAEPPGETESSAVPEEGLVERFVRMFQRFEIEEETFTTLVDESGFAWWDTARYSVQFALCRDQGIMGQRFGIPPPKMARAAALGRLLFRSAADAVTLTRSRGKNFRALYCFSRAVPLIIADLLDAPEPALVVTKGHDSARHDVVVRKQSVELFIRLVTPWMRVPDTVASAAARIERQLHALFATDRDIATIILRKYREHLARRLLWGFVLARSPALEIVAFVNDDSTKTLTALANARGIRTREYQHCYMGPSAFGFSYPPGLPRPATLPDELVIDRDSGDITYPATRIEYRPLERAVGAARDIDVLIGFNPTRLGDAMAMVEALVDKGLSLAVKLHPTQTEISVGLRQRFPEKAIMVFTGKDDFCSVVARARVFVSASPTSSTNFEAFDMGAKLVIVDYGGVKVSSALDYAVAARVDAPERLYDVIAPLLAAQAAAPPGHGEA